ncbi:hypothetical protein GLOIN_2v1811259 [Rhizophagus clarus]|uniref:CCHC-type domain-containing protein n=1 Tax=Rhizophagus clarus TaxID=94130 RepID=A0A8H3KVW3_9GLOM|nr:hypothetical protein GLOIN_2v1811259 [Rhizophagus clarus]
MVVSSGKPQVIIPARSSLPELTTLTQHTSSSTGDVDQTPDTTVTQQSNGQLEIINIPDNNDNFVLITKNFTAYTEASNFPTHIPRAERAHEATKLLKDYLGFEYIAPSNHTIIDDNNKKKIIKVIKAIFSNEDGYNKLLQNNFHFKIMKEGNNGELKEFTTSFKFKLAFVDKPCKIEEQITNEKDHTIQVFDLPLYMEKATIRCSLCLLGEIKRIEIKAEYVRVMPISLSEEQREIRKLHSLRLSGLPFGTTAINLKPIIEETNAMTCFIPRNPFNYKPMTYAYLSFKNAEDRDITIKKKFTIRQGKTDKGLFILDPATQHNICNNCGNPNHIRAGCNIPIRQSRKNNSNLTHTSSSSPKNPSTKKSQNNQQVSQVQQQYLNSLVDKLVKQLESPFPPSTSKNDANKRVQKDTEYESSSSEEEKIEDMMQTQRKLISHLDIVTGSLQGVIEGAIHNLIGGFVNKR